MVKMFVPSTGNTKKITMLTWTMELSIKLECKSNIIKLVKIINKRIRHRKTKNDLKKVVLI